MIEEVRIGGGDTAKPLNLAKRVALLRSLVELEGLRILDAGCGAGEYVEAYLTHGANPSGVEYNQNKVNEYRYKHPNSERVIQGDICSVPFANNTFDVVVLNEVIEHVPDQMMALSEMRRVLRIGGLFAIFAPNRLYPFETHGVDLRKGGRRLSPWLPLVPYVPLNLGRHWFSYTARNYWPWELADLVAESGFQITGRQWVWQTFENISGRRPQWITRASASLRYVSGVLEKCPLVRCLGATQVVLATAP
jgi:SAM-dependent methyltransferase